MFKKMMLVALVGLAMSATYAQAGARISIGIGIPLFVPIGPPPRPVYVAPAPVYVAPAPVYAPAPTYVQPTPRPVYVQPAPVYVR
jgi:PXPV repeat-containing protein